MKLSKQDAATHQLDAAIHLFLKGDYLSSLTLAGAAEEILGSLSRIAGLPVAIEAIAEHHRKDTDPALTDKESSNVIFGIANRARNSAKHANDEGETEVEIERLHPLQMIMRAMPMRRNLGLAETEATTMIRQWIEGHPEATR